MLTIVMGPSCAGKSTYIKEHFPNTEVVDILDFQANLIVATEETVLKTYEEHLNKVKELLSQGKDVVIEHTLLKAKRRLWYIQQIREVYSGDIDIICIKPSEDLLAFRSQLRHIAQWYTLLMLDELELPTFEEGYKNITIIEE